MTRRQTDRADETRERVFQSMYSILVSRGHGAATVDAVARGAGISKSAALHHFESKSGLYSAFADWLWTRMRAEVPERMDRLARLAEDKGEAPPAPLELLGFAAWEVYSSGVGIADLELSIATRSDSSITAALNRSGEAAYQAGLEMFRSAAALQGVADTDDLAVYFLLALSALRGLIFEQALNPRALVQEAAEVWIRDFAQGTLGLKGGHREIASN